MCAGSPCLVWVVGKKHAKPRLFHTRLFCNKELPPAHGQDAP